jgi:putative membrane protein
MKFIGKLIFYIFSNGAAILATSYFLPKFFNGDLTDLLKVAAMLTIINIFIKPILEFFSAPIIMLTFGFFTFIINVVIIYLLDFFSEVITIQSIKELIMATIIIGIVNLILGISVRKGFRKE